MINLELNNQEPYFTFTFHQKISLKRDPSSLEAELGLLNNLIEKFDESGRRMIVKPTNELQTEIRNLSDNIKCLSYINTINGSTNSLVSNLETLVNASHGYPFNLLPSHSVFFTASSIGVPVNLSILLIHPGSPLGHLKSLANEDDVYLIRKVLEDLYAKGISQIRNETIYKSEVIQQAILKNQCLEPAVTSKNRQSKTVIGFYHDGDDNLIDKLGKQGYHIEPPENDNPFIINNFATHSKEQFEQLSDYLACIR